MSLTTLPSARGHLLEVRMHDNVLRIHLELLDILETEVAGAVRLLVVGDLPLAEPDQGDLVLLMVRMMAVSSGDHVPQVDQGAPAGPHIDVLLRQTSPELSPKESREGKLAWRGIGATYHSAEVSAHVFVASEATSCRAWKT